MYRSHEAKLSKKYQMCLFYGHSEKANEQHTKHNGLAKKALYSTV